MVGRFGEACSCTTKVQLVANIIEKEKKVQLIY